MLLMLQVANPYWAVAESSGWNAGFDEMMSRISWLTGRTGATKQLDVLLPMVMLSLQRRTVLRPN